MGGVDLKNDINNFRELLHKELETDDLDYDKVLAMSRELDKLIVEYYNKNEEPIDF